MTIIYHLIRNIQALKNKQEKYLPQDPAITSQNIGSSTLPFDDPAISIPKMEQRQNTVPKPEMKERIAKPPPAKPEGMQPPPPPFHNSGSNQPPMAQVDQKQGSLENEQKAGSSTQPQQQKPAMPVPLPAKKQAEEVPFDLIIESDLSLRKRLKWLNTKEEKLAKIGSIALETYDDIFTELEEEIEKAEQQTLAQIDQLEYNPEIVSYTKERDIHIMKEKDPVRISADFEKYLNTLLRTDVVIRQSYRRDAYFKIHSFQWKSRQIHTYNLISGELESTLIDANFNIPLFSRSIAIENGDIYLTGGLVKPYYLKTTFFLDEASSTLVKRADMNLPRADHSLIYLAGYIYAIGSYVHNKCNNTCERYDIYKNKWTPIASLNIGRAGVGLCTVDNTYLYAFGGRNEQRVILSAIECYNIATDEWKEVEFQQKDNWIPCYMSLAHQISENEIIVFGGKSGKTQLVSKESYIYNIETGEFIDGPPLRNPSSFMNSIISWKDNLYVFGNDVYIHRFSLIDQSWSIKDKHHTNTEHVQKWL
uniref:Attractin/MKLN-like beta-propeller domain-containing protein n=1 Tax=Euplotes crassus TaxID=5936 RepID=A0A7S3P022_EUPCR|mmetsp:Transcript_37868/g.37405  ORF Transcript_37868/g.37405 Transcript_37868/m.37405 type:complete len:534 (+) Transcript_37868:769-2370(+)